MTTRICGVVGERTVSIVVTAPEVAALRLALRISVTDLGLDIRHMDSCEFRKELETQRALLQGVLGRLGGSSAAGQEEAW